MCRVAPSAISSLDSGHPTLAVVVGDLVDRRGAQLVGLEVGRRGVQQLGVEGEVAVAICLDVGVHVDRHEGVDVDRGLVHGTSGGFDRWGGSGQVPCA